MVVIWLANYRAILTHRQFVVGAQSTFKLYIIFSMIKAFTLLIITSVSSYQGYFTKGVHSKWSESSTKSGCLQLGIDFIF